MTYEREISEARNTGDFAERCGLAGDRHGGGNVGPEGNNQFTHRKKHVARTNDMGEMTWNYLVPIYPSIVLDTNYLMMI